MKLRFYERIQAILPFGVPLGIVFLAEPRVPAGCEGSDADFLCQITAAQITADPGLANRQK